MAIGFVLVIAGSMLATRPGRTEAGPTPAPAVNGPLSGASAKEGME